MKEPTFFDNSLHVRESDIHGTGLFTFSDIETNQIILEIDGELIDGNECVRREEEENNVYIFYKNEDEYIDTSKTNKIKFINHNCESNCEIDEDEFGRLFLLAKKSIKSGEELTIDYDYEEIYEECSCRKCLNG